MLLYFNIKACLVCMYALLICMTLRYRKILQDLVQYNYSCIICRQWQLVIYLSKQMRR